MHQSCKDVKVHVRKCSEKMHTSAIFKCVFMCHLRCLAQQIFPSKPARECAERRDSILSVRPGCGEIESKRGVGGRLVKFSHLRSGRAPRNSAESAVTRARCSLSARRASHPSARGQCRGWRCALSPTVAAHRLWMRSTLHQLHL